MSGPPEEDVPADPASPTPDIGTAASAVLATAPDAVVAADAAGRITYANRQAEATFGYQGSELLGKPLSILLPRAAQTRHRAHIRRFFRDPIARPMGIGMDLFGRHRDGREFPVEISLAPVVTPAGLEVFATIVDITQRKAAEEQRLQAHKLESVGRLAGGIAHDFNNVLFAIAGYCELLEVDLASSGVGPIREQALESVRAIAAAAKRGSNLTGQLLSFTRQGPVNARVIEVDDTLRLLEPMLKPLIGDGISLESRLKAGDVRVKIDPGQLDQVVVNLVVNARDAMPDGGAIVIETGSMEFDDPIVARHAEVEPGRYAIVAVSDMGTGMDEETRRQAFEPFFTTKPAGKGTGLGLATSRGIVRQAGGNILLYSEPGHGSVFKVFLPVADAHQAAAHPQPESLPTFGCGRSALVVDDEPDVRDVTTRLLVRAGLEVAAVGSGDEALAAAGSRHFDVLVTDAVMPGMSGTELADQVQGLNPRMGIVILSAGFGRVDLERAISQGVRSLGKPVNSRALLATVASAVAAARARRDTR